MVSDGNWILYGILCLTLSASFFDFCFFFTINTLQKHFDYLSYQFVNLDMVSPNTQSITLAEAITRNELIT